MSRKKRKGKVSTREAKRRQGQEWRDKGGHYIDDGDGGVVKATPVKGGFELS